MQISDPTCAPDPIRYEFAGSLTKPPCSEDVDWTVLVEPATMSRAQIESFLYGGNARPVQPLGDRSVLVDTS